MWCADKLLKEDNIPLMFFPRAFSLGSILFKKERIDCASICYCEKSENASWSYRGRLHFFIVPLNVGSDDLFLLLFSRCRCFSSLAMPFILVSVCQTQWQHWFRLPVEAHAFVAWLHETYDWPRNDWIFVRISRIPSSWGSCPKEKCISTISFNTSI